MANDMTKARVSDRLANFLQKPELSGFTIVYRGSEFNVHSFVLQMQSRVLGKACDGGFVETGQRKIDLSEEHDPAHVTNMIQYMYTFDYPEPDISQAAKLEFHVHMCLIGDKYDILGLVHLSTEKFQVVLDKIAYGIDLVPAVQAAYDAASATTAMREAIVLCVVKEREFFSNDDNGDPLDAVMLSHPEFAIDVAKAMRELNN